MGGFPSFTGESQIVGSHHPSGSREGAGVGERVVAGRLPALLRDVQSNGTLFLDDAVGESVDCDPVGNPGGGSKSYLALDIVDNGVDVVVLGDPPQSGNRIADVNGQ